jgi:hypothetical protein
MVQIFAEALMSADADAICGAAYGQRNPDQRNIRNGHRWLLERRRRAESALVSVVATSYLLGVSTPQDGEAGPDPRHGLSSRRCQRWPKISTHISLAVRGSAVETAR